MVYFNACFHRIYSKYNVIKASMLSKNLPLLPIGEGKKLCEMCLSASRLKCRLQGQGLLRWQTAHTITAVMESCWRWLPYIFKVNYEIYMHILWCGEV